MFGSAQIPPAARASISLSMLGDTPYTRTFRLAIDRLGSAEQLAQAIGASVVEIEAWAAGHAHPPLGAFLNAIDVVADRWLPSPPAQF